MTVKGYDDSMNLLRKLIPNVRKQIVRQARLAVKNHDNWFYLEERPLQVTYRPIIKADCSWFVKLIYWIAGAQDPMDTNYSEYGNSVTLFEHGTKIELAHVKPGDVATWGPNGESHAAIFVGGAPEYQLASFGRPGAPELVSLAAMTAGVHFAGEASEPVTYLRFSTVNRHLKPSKKVR